MAHLSEAEMINWMALYSATALCCAIAMALAILVLGSVHRTDPDIRSHDCHPRRWPSLPCRWPQDQRSH